MANYILSLLSTRTRVSVYLVITRRRVKCQRRERTVTSGRRRTKGERESERNGNRCEGVSRLLEIKAAETSSNCLEKIEKI